MGLHSGGDSLLQASRYPLEYSSLVGYPAQPNRWTRSRARDTCSRFNYIRLVLSLRWTCIWCYLNRRDHCNCLGLRVFSCIHLHIFQCPAAIQKGCSRRRYSFDYQVGDRDDRKFSSENYASCVQIHKFVFSDGVWVHGEVYRFYCPHVVGFGGVFDV